MNISKQIPPIDSLIDLDYDKSFASSHMPIAIKGVKGEVIYMNEYAKVLSKNSNNSIFVSYSEKLSDDTTKINELGLISVDKKIELKTESGTTEERFFHIESITLLNKFGLFYGTLFIFQDLTSLVNFIISNKFNSDNKAYDEITGMFLKNQFTDIFLREIERATRYGSTLAVSVFNFENLLFFGQTFGDEKLNQVLKFIGIYFKRKFRKTDIFFRMDFNNFMGIFPHTYYENAYNKFKKMKNDFAELLRFQDSIKPVLRYGISELNLKKHYKNYDLLVEEAKIDLKSRKN